MLVARLSLPQPTPVPAWRQGTNDVGAMYGMGARAPRQSQPARLEFECHASGKLRAHMATPHVDVRHNVWAAVLVARSAARLKRGLGEQ